MVNITEESSGQTDVNIMAPHPARDLIRITSEICGVSPYRVSPCEISAPARATMEAAAGARAAALGVGADAWHSAQNLEARGGRTEKQFLGPKKADPSAPSWRHRRAAAQRRSEFAPIWVTAPQNGRLERAGRRRKRRFLNQIEKELQPHRWEENP